MVVPIQIRMLFDYFEGLNSLKIVSAKYGYTHFILINTSSFVGISKVFIGVGTSRGFLINQGLLDT